MGPAGDPDCTLSEKHRFPGKEIMVSSVRNELKPLRLLLEAKDATGVNWRKISRMMPSARRYALDRAPTVEERGGWSGVAASVSGVHPDDAIFRGFGVFTCHA